MRATSDEERLVAEESENGVGGAHRSLGAASSGWQVYRLVVSEDVISRLGCSMPQSRCLNRARTTKETGQGAGEKNRSRDPA